MYLKVLNVPNFGHEVLQLVNAGQHQRTPLDWAEQEGHLEAHARNVFVQSIWTVYNHIVIWFGVILRPLVFHGIFMFKRFSNVISQYILHVFRYHHIYIYTLRYLMGISACFKILLSTMP